MLENLIDYYKNENKRNMEVLNWDESLIIDIKINERIIECLKETILELETDVW